MKRALEGELANQIQDIAGVSDATVNLAMPQETLFLADQKQPTASVLLTLNGSGFDDTAVRGVQRLVANAVTGLTPANVVITDQAGSLLSSSDGGIGDAAASKLATESSYSRQLESGAQQIVDQMLGAGRGARLGQRAAQPRLADAEEGHLRQDRRAAARRRPRRSALKGSGAGASGAAGTTSNIPGYTGGTSAGGATELHAHEGRQHERRRPDRHRHDGGGRHADEPVRRDRLRRAALDAQGRLGDDADARACRRRIRSPRRRPCRPTSGSRRRTSTTGTDTFQTSVSSVAGRGLDGTGGVASFVPASSISKGSSGGPIPAIVTEPPARGCGRRRRARPALPRRGARCAAARRCSAAPRRAGCRPSRRRRSRSTTSRCPSGPSQGELEAANKKALQGRVEEIAGQRPSDVAQQLRGWLAEDS